MQRCAAAALRTRHSIIRQEKSVSATGYVSGCDTPGCFVAVARAKQSRQDDDAGGAVSVCQRRGSIRLRAAGQTEERATNLCEEVASESGTRFIEAPIAKLMPLIEGAAERKR